jgi:probable rRNA maturation factor
MTATESTEAPTPVTTAQDRLLITLQDARPDAAGDRQGPLPRTPELERWAAAALEAGSSATGQRLPEPVKLTIRIVGEDESAELNQRYRGRPGATNILSFAFELPPGLDPEEPQVQALTALLGDLIICDPVVRREAQAQGKAEGAHWAHLVVHGVLHLLGFDHLDTAEAAAMEALEIRILGTLGFPSPYEVSDDVHDERRRI